MIKANPVARLPANDRGRDFVVGDLHGCFHLLSIALDRVNFDPACDRLFSVGDLVDRGPDSGAALEFLRNPWVFAVRGNHEEMLMDADIDRTVNRDHFRSSLGVGAGWWLDIDEALRAKFRTAFAALPIAIDVGDGQFGLVHADVAHGASWGQFLAGLETFDAETHRTAVWNRERVSTQDHRGVAGLKALFVGHTRIDMPLLLGNVWAIDTGAVYGYLGKATFGALTLVQVGSGAEELAACHETRHMVRVVAA